MGFPIRKSPDHSLLAASRSLSQLITSFIAYLRQGIHTHALSSLTIKSTSHTTRPYLPAHTAPAFRAVNATFFALCTLLVFCNARQYSVVKDLDCLSNQLSGQAQQTAELVGLGGLEPPTSSLSGMRSSHLSYRPRRLHLVELVGIEPATS